MSIPILSVKIHFEQDVVLARQRARAIAEAIGFDMNDQSRLATAVSEIARNAFLYAGGGDVEFFIEEKQRPQVFAIRIQDQGPGIEDLEAIYEGRYQSKTGMGLGIAGAKRLMDLFNIDSIRDKGTVVTFGRLIPARIPAISAATCGGIVDAIMRRKPGDPFDEIRRQNQEVLAMFAEIKRQKEALEELNRELTDTNRGMVALYAELDEKATNLKKANELKVRFLSNMSHEFKTPLNSILALSQLLLGRSDGELTEEQEKQVAFIRKAAEDLAGLVNDLLDLAKIEAGKIVLHLSEFEAEDIFSTLRGMFKPIQINPALQLVFEDCAGLPLFRSDEGKISQILRNLVSNALKFTERGEVRVAVGLSMDRTQAVFTVTDTGIGIAKENQEKIFEEYGQIDSPIQRKLKGTGLGLPLSRKLAALLGGTLTVRSVPGEGSVFCASIPIVYVQSHEGQEEAPGGEDVLRIPVLVIEDDEETQKLYEAFLHGSGFQVLKAYNCREAGKILSATMPIAIVLDILMPGENGWRFLLDLKGNPALRDIPVFITTILEDRDQALSLGAADFCTKPVDRSWILKQLKGLAARRPLAKVLIIDDEEVSRYLLKGALADTKFTILESENGTRGLQMAIEELPELIFLDLMMPDMTGFEVLVELRKDARTKSIPVIVVTSKVLDEHELAILKEKTSAVVPKNVTSRAAMLSEIRTALTHITSYRGSVAP